jgi:hypothetical protein
VRLALPHIHPLEIWDLPVAGTLLQEWRHDPAFPAYLSAAIAALRREPPATFPPAITRFTHVFACGGAASLASALELPTIIDDDPFTAARAAFGHASSTRIIDDARDAAIDAGSTRDRAGSTVGADLGQTSLKLAAGDRTIRIARDLARAPVRDDTPLAAREAARSSTIAWLAEALATVAAEHIVLGLPCELDPDGHPRSCTYCFRDPDRTLIEELRAALATPTIVVANDAELAALAALADPRVPRDQIVLVLTIGFGVGGALLVPA